MISAIWNKIKSWARWVYDWITVITASLVGLPSVVISLLDSLGAINMAPLVGPEIALKIVTSVAIVKALLAFIESCMKPKDGV